ncbi:MAG: adenosylcobalamin-dependent ribonucleoside-diphosphate reductase [Pseudomonadota bacterium]
MPANHDAPFELPLSREIWHAKYRYADPEGAGEQRIDETWERVAAALAAVETGEREIWSKHFRGVLEDFRFLPGGRILAGAGTGRRVTLFNCFVMGIIEDSMDGIFEALKEGALTMQQGGGVGYDFSTLRPSGFAARAHGGVASGPVSFMRIWDSMCATLLSTGHRRGAMMATLRCDHPDIGEFIDAKRDADELRNFNLSVQVTDDFMHAVKADAPWPLVFPAPALAGDQGSLLRRRWPGFEEAVECRVVRTVAARELWSQLLDASYACAEPGVLFVDRINQENNLGYREHISATNPCGEIPLPPYGACNLGSVNLVKFVRDPFTDKARLDQDALADCVNIAVRLMDNVVDASRFPLPAQAGEARGSRRLGLGITGFADALIMLDRHYADKESREFAAGIMRHIRDTAYRASVALAREKGAFPHFERDRYLESPFVRRLDPELRDAIAAHGIRNSHLLAIAPTGTISVLANNVSNGLEPVFAFDYERRVRQADGSLSVHQVDDYAWRLYHRLYRRAPRSRAFVDALSLSPEQHLHMQAALQPYVDNAISKTVNVPREADFATYRTIFEQAHELGLKGCTTFRPNPVTGAVLSPTATAPAQCCSLEREPD